MSKYKTNESEIFIVECKCKYYRQEWQEIYCFSRNKELSVLVLICSSMTFRVCKNETDTYLFITLFVY